MAELINVNFHARDETEREPSAGLQGGNGHAW